MVSHRHATGGGGSSALLEALRAKNLEAVNVLLKECGANPNASDAFGLSPLIVACSTQASRVPRRALQMRRVPRRALQMSHVPRRVLQRFEGLAGALTPSHRVITGYSPGSYRVVTGYSPGTHRVLTG